MRFISLTTVVASILTSLSLSFAETPINTPKERAYSPASIEFFISNKTQGDVIKREDSLFLFASNESIDAFDAQFSIRAICPTSNLDQTIVLDTKILNPERSDNVEVGISQLGLKDIDSGICQLIPIVTITKENGFHMRRKGKGVILIQNGSDFTALPRDTWMEQNTDANGVIKID